MALFNASHYHPCTDIFVTTDSSRRRSLSAERDAVQPFVQGNIDVLSHGFSVERN